MTKSKLGSAYARVKLVIEVPAGSSWGPECSLDQIYKQAGGETLNKVRNMFDKEYGVGRVRFTEQPEVTAISVVEQK